MIEFVGSLEGTLDKKGRCSVPADFRRLLDGQPLYLRPSVRGPFLEAWPSLDFANANAPRLGPLDIPSEEEDDRLYALIAVVVPVQPDTEGRIIVPAHLIGHAELGNELYFVGRRSFFEIWSRQAFHARLNRALSATRPVARAS
jgi:MraZ protein